MQIQSLADAIICLRHAFKYAEASEGPQFWQQIDDRLTFYHAEALKGRYCDTGYLGPSANLPAPKFAPPAKFKTLSPEYAYWVADGINSGFGWSLTPEGRTYWHAIREHLTALVALGSYVGSRMLDHESSATATATAPSQERSDLHNRSLIRPEFADMLWYRPGQWPHHDPSDPTLVRYLPKGKPPKLSNFVTSKPGKFLASYYDDLLTETQIADLAAKFRAAGEPPKLLLARTADEIVRIYATGPTSCMSGGKRIDGIEPVRAYESPDLAIAYIERAGRPTARSLVRLDKKAYMRIYGDAAAFKPALIRAGFDQAARSGDTVNPALFYGVRLSALRSPNVRPAHAFYEEADEPVCITPYFDVSAAATFNAKDGFLHVGPDSSAVKRGKPAIHHMRGGYSIAAIPKTGALPICQGIYLQITCGHSSSNTKGFLSLDDAERDPKATMKENAEAALAKKKILDKARAIEQLRHYAEARYRDEAMMMPRRYEDPHG